MEQKQKTKPARQQKRDRSHLVFMMIAAVAAVYRTQLFWYFFGSAGNDTGYARHGE